MYFKYSHLVNINKGARRNDSDLKFKYKYKQHHHVSLDGEFKADCQIWIEFFQGELATVVNRPMVDILGQLRTSKDIQYSLDASASAKQGFGYGCVLNYCWIQGNWNPEFILAEKPSIEYLELFALCMGIRTWEDSIELTNCQVAIFCDNIAVVHMINSMTSGCANCMFLICLLALNNLKFNRRLSARYISMKDNFALSRGQLSRFRKLRPYMRMHADPPSTVIWAPEKVWLKSV